MSRPSFFYFEGKTYIHHVIKLNIMLHAQVFKEFISIGVTTRVYKIGRQMNPKYGKDGMNGYDMQDFLESIVSDSLLDQVQMDPESGGFYCYFNLEKDREITRNDIHKLRMWMPSGMEIHLERQRFHRCLGSYRYWSKTQDQIVAQQDQSDL